MGECHIGLIVLIPLLLFKNEREVSYSDYVYVFTQAEKSDDSRNHHIVIILDTRKLAQNKGGPWSRVPQTHI